MGRSADRLAGLLLRLSRIDRRAASMLLHRPSLVPMLLDVAVTRRPLTAATLLRAVL